MGEWRWSIDKLAASLRRFGEHECRGYGPRYEALSYRVADDPEILALCRGATPGQPPPNLLFAAVRYVTFDDREATKAIYDEPDDARAFAAFRTVALAAADRIAELIATERVQTNSVGRSAAIAVGLTRAREWTGRAPLALVEVGASAGLNLVLDRFRIEFGVWGAIGPADARVVVRTDARGERLPLPERLPAIGSRVGLDVRPVDLRDTHARRWLRALVWPEHPERLQRLDAAIDEFLTDPPELTTCDATATLADVVSGLPRDRVPVVVHTSMAHQLDERQRVDFAGELARASQDRPVVRIAVENHGERWNDLDVCVHHGAHVDRHRLARVQPHGRWIELLPAFD